MARLGQPVPLQIVPHHPIAGPGDMVYGLFVDDVGGTVSAVAVPLSGLDSGGFVASAELDATQYAHLPRFALGHGATGLVAMSDPSRPELLAYSDESGAPTTFVDAVPMLSVDDADLVSAAPGDVPVSGATSWALDIERAPGAAPPGGGAEAPVALDRGRRPVAHEPRTGAAGGDRFHRHHHRHHHRRNDAGAGRSPPRRKRRVLERSRRTGRW